MKVLGISVEPSLIAAWADWYAPKVQPFLVESERGLPTSLDGEFSAELRDSFKAWSPANRGKKVVWFDEPLAAEAGLAFRSAESVIAFVEREGRIPHTRVNGAPSFAGTFARGSGPNCFGTTMAAAGVPNAEDEWMMIEPFNEWLAASCKKGGRDDGAGTVLLWRDTSNGQPWHSALTIGNGWAIEKASQCWWSPRYVATVADIKRVSRDRGLRLERWQLK